MFNISCVTQPYDPVFFTQDNLVEERVTDLISKVYTLYLKQILELRLNEDLIFVNSFIYKFNCKDQETVVLVEQIISKLKDSSDQQIKLIARWLGEIELQPLEEKKNKFRKIVFLLEHSSELVDLGLTIETTLLHWFQAAIPQTLSSYERAKKIGTLLVSSDKGVQLDLIPIIKDGMKLSSTSKFKEERYLARVLTLLATSKPLQESLRVNPTINLSIKGLEVVSSFKGKERVTITDVEQLLMTTLLYQKSQGQINNCFSSAICRQVQYNTPLQGIEDWKALLYKGSLIRHLSGRDVSAPINSLTSKKIIAKVGVDNSETLSPISGLIEKEIPSEYSLEEGVAFVAYESYYSLERPLYSFEYHHQKLVDWVNGGLENPLTSLWEQSVADLGELSSYSYFKEMVTSVSITVLNSSLKVLALSLRISFIDLKEAFKKLLLSQQQWVFNSEIEFAEEHLSGLGGFEFYNTKGNLDSATWSKVETLEEYLDYLYTTLLETVSRLGGDKSPSHFYSIKSYLKNLLESDSIKRSIEKQWLRKFPLEKGTLWGAKSGHHPDEILSAYKESSQHTKESISPKTGLELFHHLVKKIEDSSKIKLVVARGIHTATLLPSMSKDPTLLEVEESCLKEEFKDQDFTSFSLEELPHSVKERIWDSAYHLIDTQWEEKGENLFMSYFFNPLSKEYEWGMLGEKGNAIFTLNQEYWVTHCTWELIE